MLHQTRRPPTWSDNTAYFALMASNQQTVPSSGTSDRMVAEKWGRRQQQQQQQQWQETEKRLQGGIDAVRRGPPQLMADGGRGYRADCPTVQRREAHGY